MLGKSNMHVIRKQDLDKRKYDNIGGTSSQLYPFLAPEIRHNISTSGECSIYLAKDSRTYHFSSWHAIVCLV